MLRLADFTAERQGGRAAEHGAVSYLCGALAPKLRMLDERGRLVADCDGPQAQVALAWGAKLAASLVPEVEKASGLHLRYADNAVSASDGSCGISVDWRLAESAKAAPTVWVEQKLSITDTVERALERGEPSVDFFRKVATAAPGTFGLLVPGEKKRPPIPVGHWKVPAPTTVGVLAVVGRAVGPGGGAWELRLSPAQQPSRRGVPAVAREFRGTCDWPAGFLTPKPPSVLGSLLGFRTPKLASALGSFIGSFLAPKKAIAKKTARAYVRHAEKKDKYRKYEKTRVRSAAQQATRRERAAQVRLEKGTKGTEQARGWARAFVLTHGAEEVRTRNKKRNREFRARQKLAAKEAAE